MNKLIGKCDECFNEGRLRKAPACADTDVGYGDCCLKYICYRKCFWKCTVCLKENSNSEDVFITYEYIGDFKKREIELKQCLNYISCLYLYSDLSFSEKKIKLLKNVLPNDVCILIQKMNISNYVKSIICKKCVNDKNIPTEDPIQWNGMSSQAWLDRYD